MAHYYETNDNTREHSGIISFRTAEALAWGDKVTLNGITRTVNWVRKGVLLSLTNPDPVIETYDVVTEPCDHTET